MTQEQFNAFLIKAKGDISLQEKLKAAASSEDVVAIAKDHGHTFTADKINLLSEDELEGVAGGLGFCVVSQANYSNLCISNNCKGGGVIF
tara:strand:+ start:130 stop:399 length:270 start_codon:yes stop_codon:yes gene_type:complete